jgi:hypothetical protein
MSEGVVLPPQVVIPKDWNGEALKFIDFLSPSSTGRIYSYTQIEADQPEYEIVLANPENTERIPIGKMTAEKRQDGVYLTSATSDMMDIREKGMYAACLGEIMDIFVKGASLQYLYISFEGLETMDDLKAYLRDEKIKFAIGE